MMTDALTTLRTLLAKQDGDVRHVEHFLNFASEEGAQAFIRKVIALGFKVDSLRDLNAGLSPDLPYETDEELHDANQLWMKFHQLGLDPPERAPRRKRTPWSLVMSARHDTDEVLSEMHGILELLAEEHGGTYDGHGYMLQGPGE